MSFSISLIDFWKLRRHAAGERCIVRPFHNLIADHLTRLMLGQLSKPNLMILMPPRCAKTDLVVKTFEPWAFSYFPDSEFINSSYGQALATENNIEVRDCLTSEWYRSMVGSDWGATVALRGEKAGGKQDHFYTEEGGSCKAVGVGGGIVGFGAGKLREEFGGAIVMDDMLKPVDAKSPTSRAAAINTIRNTLESRRNRKMDPMTPEILVMQRLHPQDPAGYFLKEEKERWTVLDVPAEIDGISIWPERISIRELNHMKEVDPETYWAQMMQQPSQAAHTIFKDHYWQRWASIKEVESRITLKFITMDTAFKDKDANDFSVLQCWGCIGISGLVLLDQERGKWEFPELVTHSKAFLEKHSRRQIGFTPATELWIEDKASGQSLVQTLNREGIGANAWEPEEGTAKDKVGRAQQCVLPLAASRVAVPHEHLPGYKWVEGFVQEHSAFTKDDSHLYDDQVDTCTMAILIWMQRGGGTGPLPEPYIQMQQNSGTGAWELNQGG